MYKRKDHFEDISKMLSILKVYISLHNSAGLRDVNTISEHFFAGLLNKIFDLKFKNMNLIKVNFPAIDLGDTNKKICYQVTYTNDRTKLNETLQKFVEHKLYNTFEELNILILSDKKNYKPFNHVTGINFDPKKNIIDISSLMYLISRITDIKKLEEISDYLRRELHGISLPDSDPLENNIIEIMEKEILENLTLLSRSVRYDNDKKPITPKDILNYLNDDDFLYYKREKNSAIKMLTTLKFDTYNKYEDKLLSFKSHRAKEIIPLYFQFKIWNKYNQLTEMRLDEFVEFKRILAYELNKHIMGHINALTGERYEN
ncbi:SMEK domain-containing protein [Bacillus sp. 179-I 2A5 NHS]|uniref:SMEK domain-containing protein n=1 Tax=Bacillus sp. 179-I 2A5 NHS TaxID=3374300 RepID=UPI00387A0A37